MENKKDFISGVFCAIGCEILFGLSFIFTKQATSQASAFTLLGWRFLLALVVMSVFAKIGVIRINYKGKNLKPLFKLAIFSPVIYFVGETLGVIYTTASESGVIIACIPVTSLLASTLILKKKPKTNQVFGIIFALIGVLITVFAVGNSASLSFIGYTLLIMAVIACTLHLVYVEKAVAFNSGEITYMMLICGTLVFVTIAVIEAFYANKLRELLLLPFSNINFLIAILYLGIGCSIFAFFLSNMAVAKLGVNRTSSFIGLATVVSILAGVIVLKESFSIFQIIGAGIILVGVYMANADKIQ